MKRRLQLLPILLFSIFFLLLNNYVLGGIQILFPWKFFPLLFWGFIAFSISILIYAIAGMVSRGMGAVFKFATHLFLILFTAEILFSAVLLLNDVVRFGQGIFNAVQGSTFLLPKRNEWIVAMAMGIAAITVLLFIYGIVRGKYVYRVIKHQLYFKDLPDAFDGFTLVQISDVHAGSFTNAKEVKKGIDMINAQKADLFVFTGDLVNNKAEEIKPWISYFSAIKAPFGQFSVLGNHDYGDYVKWESEAQKQQNLKQLKAYHQEMGFRLLLDERVELTKDGQKISLLGIENWGLGFGERGDLKKALLGSKTEDFKILLSHDPSHWESQVKANPAHIQLSLAGHTHGMQFGIEAFGIKWSPVKYRYAHWAGIKAENGRYLNVNRGFGFIGFSGRVGIWPEITLITLKKA